MHAYHTSVETGCTSITRLSRRTIAHHFQRYPDKTLPEKIPPKNPFEWRWVRTCSDRVLNPIASEASYKPKQRSNRKTKLKKNIYIFFFRGDFSRGDFIWEPFPTYLQTWAWQIHRKNSLIYHRWIYSFMGRGRTSTNIYKIKYKRI